MDKIKMLYLGLALVVVGAIVQQPIICLIGGGLTAFGFMTATAPSGKRTHLDGKK